jgi:hypothetical protein
VVKASAQVQQNVRSYCSHFKMRRLLNQARKSIAGCKSPSADASSGRDAVYNPENNDKAACNPESNDKKIREEFKPVVSATPMYRQLRQESEDEFRVLVLFPGQETNHITCRLEYRFFDSIEYEALSYTCNNR